MTDTQEKTFYENGQVKVTNARFMVPSQTYAIAGITSVKFYSEKPNILWPILAFIVAFVALANNGNIWAIGIPLLVGILLLLRKAKHHVVLSSASGEMRALESTNKEFISSVINGLNQAIISRS